MKSISIVILFLLNCSCTSVKQNSNLYGGTWVAERRGLSDSIIFLENGVIRMYIDGHQLIGDSAEHNGIKIKSTFTMDCTKNPCWFDIQHMDLKTNRIFDTTIGIIKFISDNKLMLRQPFEKASGRPIDFDYEKKISETMVYTKQTTN
jgi:hypothetical protein